MSVRAFLLEREQGNVVVYNAPGLADVRDEIRDGGGADMLLINHEHEGMFGAPPIDTRVYVHARDRAGLGGPPVAGTFSARQAIASDLEAIPIQGHTPGSTAYLWASVGHRFLITGDSVWLGHGEWCAIVLDPNGQRAYLDSLALMRDLDFDVLVPGGRRKASLMSPP